MRCLQATLSAPCNADATGMPDLNAVSQSLRLAYANALKN